MRFPIWPCSVRGLPCLRYHYRSGGLLPHLFTLTQHLFIFSYSFNPQQSKNKNRCWAVCFLWHFPSPFGDRAFPGALPCGVRTFLKGVTFAIVRLSSFKYYTVKLKFSNIIKQLTFLPGNFKRRHKKTEKALGLEPPTSPITIGMLCL